MKRTKGLTLLVLALTGLFLVLAPTAEAIYTQCPEDTDGIDADGNGIVDDDIVCMHISGGDGFQKMADGRYMYIFSFGPVPAGTPESQIVSTMTLKANSPAPLITLRQGQELYLTMSNVGMVMRPDLFDPHSVHWHGFPNAAPIFDGLPEPSPTPIMGASLTYYYKAAVPGTYFYHCHVEAAEHMQMGMIGNLWVYPTQDNTPGGIGGFTKFAYNDGDGSTGYDVEYAVQLTGYDSNFHDASENVQALPFAAMFDDYPLINGRGYPDTINTTEPMGDPNSPDACLDPNVICNGQDPNYWAQRTHSLMTAQTGQSILLRVSNVSTTHLYSIATTLGVPMHVVGRGAALLRGPNGDDTSFMANVLNVGGGQAFDVIINTTGVPAGTYLLYITNLENLSNGAEERGGGMTEIVITN